ncbi:MAG: sulfurtransferase TusA family protein [Heliobacteriaceae bacterium]|nr:sulfurtransferase TusA family protein [Heliobacteriaceae bacterium]MDD4588251.1 sulfurtransferase TusA family protein [Heliobacteriaceae bacterium]
MVLELDFRGLSCPLPVMRTKEALTGKPAGEVLIWVDAAAPKQNVTRFLTSQGYTVTVAEENGCDVRLSARKG